MREHNLPLYESQPPDWLPKAHVSADLGRHLVQITTTCIHPRVPQATLVSIPHGLAKTRMC